MKIGDLVLIRNGGAYGLYNLQNSNGEILKTGSAGIILEKIAVSKRGNISGVPTNYYSVYCKISIDNLSLWVAEGMLQSPGKKLLWAYTKKYATKPKIY